jgi:hypothetical protein
MPRVTQSDLQSTHITIVDPPARALRRVTNADIQSPRLRILQRSISEITRSKMQ